MHAASGVASTQMKRCRTTMLVRADRRRVLVVSDLAMLCEMHDRLDHFHRRREDRECEQNGQYANAQDWETIAAS